ncbi:HepT-like ribonuclease domain-containing protein [Thiothrix nivea]|uniref:Nucleotidyltransferase n=1 Tax=Thiothrix nivea (strain ATCC 35100 / DSM 5205 / JP2) TaxID=870187 RepID=A0A656HHH9_THINJ|nr:DUF86 domain-containing protein [Thiothrix nivea]EIJ34485.1 protein of unknown function DUF86 [Thiothrix nivea DSM 5205]
MSREWRFYLDDMIEFAELVLEYTEGYSQEQFEQDRRTYDATLRNMELIGEAATHIPDEIREQAPSIPWRQLIATRNRIIHAYLGLDNDILWSIVQTDIPQLLNDLRQLK